eukprot:754797-Hanusia_phi.AAC.2
MGYEGGMPFMGPGQPMEGCGTGGGSPPGSPAAPRRCPSLAPAAEQRETGHAPSASTYRQELLSPRTERHPELDGLGNRNQRADKERIMRPWGQTGSDRSQGPGGLQACLS